jgi:hypothetical protein
MFANGKPVTISSLSDAEFDAAWKPPAGPPPQMPPPALQTAHQKLPPELQRLHLEFERRLLDSIRVATPDSMSATMHSEHTALAELRRIDTADEHSLKDLPLIVLSRGVNAGPGQRALQARLAQLSTNSRQIVVADSDHEIHLFRPDVVIQAIADVQTLKGAK